MPLYNSYFYFKHKHITLETYNGLALSKCTNQLTIQ
jgi:hypothetical protein